MSLRNEIRIFYSLISQFRIMIHLCWDRILFHTFFIFASILSNIEWNISVSERSPWACFKLKQAAPKAWQKVEELL